MSEPTAEDIVGVVSATLHVETVERTPYTVRLGVTGENIKEGFVEVAQKLETMGLICSLDSESDGLFVTVRKLPPVRRRKWLSKSWTPRLLFGVVVVFVMVDGYYRTLGANQIVDIGDPLVMSAIYTLSLLGILGIHETGHLLASRWHKLKTTWPYFIPGIPIYGIPTFGAFIQSRGLTVNREILFDIAIAGPIAGLVITILVTAYGAYAAPVIPVELAEQLYDESRLVEWSQGEPLLMTAILTVFGKGGGEQQILLTPVLFAAWIGFLITFLNLLPAWQLDGGHMARTLLGVKWHRYATYASMGVLVLLGYWIMALFILLLSSRSSGAQPLDDISPLPRNRKWAYAAVVALAALCAPLPESFTLPW